MIEEVQGAVLSNALAGTFILFSGNGHHAIGKHKNEFVGQPVSTNAARVPRKRAQEARDLPGNGWNAAKTRQHSTSNTDSLSIDLGPSDDAKHNRAKGSVNF